MTANMAVVSPPEAEATASLVTRNRIVCFVNDEFSAAALRKGLEGGNLSIRRGTIRNAIRMLETDTELFALVVDISGIDDPFTELERLSAVCPPDIQVALIGESREITFYRELMEIGVTEYLPRPLTRDLVLDKLRPKLLGDVAPGSADHGGHVVSICGAQGGAGATSIAINLALQLAETTKAKVALLDLHLQNGETAVMLGVRPGPGLRIALENPMRADTLFLERAAIDINERVCLISADEELDAQLDIAEAGVRQAVNLGIPALKHVPGLRRYLAPIVREIAGVGAQRKGLLRRLLRL